MTLVWHLSSNRWNSAITEYALSCARACEIAGARSVFSPLEDSPAEKRAKAADLRVIPFRGFGAAFANFKYRDQLHQLRPDVIITYGGAETVLTKIHGGARVVRFRGQEIDDGAWTRFRHKLSHRHVDVILAPSASLTEKLKALTPETPVHHVVLGVADGRFHLPVQHPPRRSPPEIVVLGRFDPVKGHTTAFALQRALLDQWREAAPPPVLHVVGEPANLSVKDLESAAAKAGLRAGQDYKITARRMDDVPSLVMGAAVGLVPSTGSEIIGRVAEEFLLCGTPVAVSGVGSLDELLFEDAGFSYRGLSATDAATRLKEWVKRSAAEISTERYLRASAAKERYSLPAMARQLKQILKLEVRADSVD